MLGAPAILQSQNGIEFSRPTNSQTCATWRDVKLLHKKPRQKPVKPKAGFEKANKGTQNLLTAWTNNKDK